MIRKLTIRGFKAIAEAELDLGKLNVFVGANGAGKSAVLEAIGYAGAAAFGAVTHDAVHLRGLRYGDPRHVVCALDNKEYVQAIGLDVENDRAAYHIELGGSQSVDGANWQFASEILRSDGKVWLERTPTRVFLRSSEPPNSPDFEAPRVTDGVASGIRAWAPPESVLELLNILQDYRVYAFSTPILRGQTADPWPRDPLGLGGSQLSSALASTADKAMREVIQDHVCELIDWVEDVFGKGESHHAEPGKVGGVNLNPQDVEFQDRYMRDGRNVVTGTEASEGALHVLAALLALLHPQTPKFFAIDNVDTALNPWIARLLVRKIQELLKNEAADRQILVTAHNPSVLDGLNIADPDVRLFAVSRLSNGASYVHQIDLASIDVSLHERTLSDLWLSGLLGGMPAVW